MPRRVRMKLGEHGGGDEDSYSMLQSAPGPFVQNGDFLRLNATSTNASATLQLNGRLLTFDGEIVPFNVTMTITGTGNQTAVSTPLTDGWIIGFIVFVSAGTVTDGQIVTSVEVVQGSGTPATRVMSLAAGEVTNTRSLGLHGYLINGPATTQPQPTMVTTAIANPGAGAEVVVTVTAGQVWEIQGFRGDFTTSAAVATREVDIVCDDGTNTIFRLSAIVSQTAGLGFTYNASRFGAAYSPPVSNFMMIPLPQIMLAGGYRIRTATNAIQAADQYGSWVVSYRQY